jgi:phosphoglycolate phosphatase
VPADALIFDLDGTLWDTNAVCAAAWNRVVGRLGIVHRELTAADMRAIAGLPHEECVRRLFPGLPEAQLAVLVQESQQEDNRTLAEVGGDLYPGVREHLAGLRRRWPLMIVSNCQSGYIEAFFSSSGLGGHFVDFECWGNTGRGKADNLGAVIERNRLRRPYFVGDTEGDREAAAANGAVFVYASYGFGEVRGWDRRIERFADLLELD